MASNALQATYGIAILLLLVYLSDLRPSRLSVVGLSGILIERDVLRCCCHQKSNPCLKLRLLSACHKYLSAVIAVPTTVFV
jgi:hypothetical protein